MPTSGVYRTINNRDLDRKRYSDKIFVKGYAQHGCGPSPIHAAVRGPAVRTRRGRFEFRNRNEKMSSIPKIVEMLINLPHAASSINAPDSDTGETVLHYAVSLGDIKTVKLLIDSGLCDLGVVCKIYGRTALHNAARSNYVWTVGGYCGPEHLLKFAEIYEVLLNGNGNSLNTINIINVADKNGDTALHLVAEIAGVHNWGSSYEEEEQMINGYCKIAEALLKRGANVCLRNNKGCTALDMAIAPSRDGYDYNRILRGKAHSDVEVEKMLNSYRSIHGKEPKNGKIVELLLKTHASDDVRICDGFGRESK